MAETIYRRASVDGILAHLAQDDEGSFIRVKRAGAVHIERFESWADAEENWDELLTSMGIRLNNDEVVDIEGLGQPKTLSTRPSGHFETTENVYRRAAFAISNASAETIENVRVSLLTDKNFCERAEEILKLASKTTWVDAAIRTLCKVAIAEVSKPLVTAKQDMTELPTFGAF